MECELYSEDIEQWKDIYYYDFTKNEWVDYLGIYKISTHGRVKSLNYGRKGQERILKAFKNRDGYELVNLCKNSKREFFCIHRLVSFIFIENDDILNKTEVNHIDENKSNNNVSNLEWVSHTVNMNHGTRNRRASDSMKGKYTGENSSRWNKGKKVICITTGEIYESLHDAERQTGILSGNIVSCCKGRTKSAGKHPETGEKLVWKYYDEV